MYDIMGTSYGIELFMVRVMMMINIIFLLYSYIFRYSASTFIKEALFPHAGSMTLADPV